MARTLNAEEKRIIFNVLDNYVCGDYVFNSNFDSGNLGQVELVRSCPDLETAENIVHAEFNAWTTPDCYGTANESPNRTWFFFSVKGGRPNRNVKINIKNLNRQAKLFNQGMQPVVRIGPHGKWERIKEKPLCGMEDDNFCMSFIHRPLDLPHIEHYYAFTYPFTYTECQNMLEKIEKKHQKSANDLNYIIQRLLNPGSVTNKNQQQSRLEALIAKGQSIRRSLSPDLIVSTATQTDPESYDKYTDKELENEIYYYRELLIYSLDGRRVELITISSFHGIQDKREDRLLNLFPETRDRCHIFNDKKIIFLSSRVHPGETPASFVLNGFINLLLDKKSVIASTLRQLYVFKIVPILNPDGVFKGHYRTDTLGQNLNRMYINPKIEMHPSIYAVKKLIKFYHLGYDSCEDNNNFGESSSETFIKNDSSSSSSLSCDNNCIAKVELTIKTDAQNNETVNTLENKSSTDSYRDCTSSDGEEFGTRISTTDSESNGKDVKAKVFTDKLIPEIKATAQEPCAKKISTNQLFTKKSSDIKMKKSSTKQVLGSFHNSTVKTSDQKPKDYYQAQQRAITKRVPQKKDLKTGSTKNLSVSSAGNKSNKKNILSSFNVSSNISSRNNPLTIERGNNDEKSNMFLYIDFHGHASKKGVFMYGNHFSNSPEAVECMLLPRLMSINCHHFHYDACNFSERNMYRREKRDGLSKEGSGRVAVYKMTGIIKSYTLESNYNTGKYCNVLPGRGKDNAAKVMNVIPPKYTPTTYEEVGRALGPSILDLTNSNCLSRIHNSDYRSLHGMRISIKNEIERNIMHRSAPSHTTAKVLSAHENVKRIKRHSISATSTLPSKETAKENKASFSGVWESEPATTSSGSKVVPSTAQSKSQLKTIRNVKKSSLKVRSTTFFGRRESCKKKTKVLSESASSSSNKKDQQFHVPTKKAKVTTQKDPAQISAPKTLSSQNTSSYPHKSPLHESIIIRGVSNPSSDVEKLDDALMKTHNSLFVEVGTRTDEIFHPRRTSDTDYEDCKPVEASNSACSIVTLSKGVNNSSSSIVTILTTTAVVDDAVPSCSGMALPPTHTMGFRENIKPEIFVTKSRDISSDLNLRVRSAFGGSENSKLLRKKRRVRHDTVLLKRKKSKLKKPLH